jgi:hypothetical protein
MPETTSTEREDSVEDHQPPEPAQLTGFVWADVTLADLEACHFESPIAELAVSPDYELANRYSHAANDSISTSPEHKIFWLLESVLSLHLRSGTPTNPFGPKIVLSNGQRTAIPEDFKGQSLEVLAEAASRATHPVLRSRLCDVAWLLDRRSSDLGRAAISSYLTIVDTLTSVEKDDDALITLRTDGYHALRRALEISHTMGWAGTEADAARATLLRISAHAAKIRDRVLLYRMSELDLRFGISESSSVGLALESILDTNVDDFEADMMWCRAAQAYREAGDNDGHVRCLSKAADWLVAKSEHALHVQNSAMLASHWLGVAISRLHGLPGVRERRAKLRHRLIDVQAGIPDEMGHFFQPLDLRDIAKPVEKAFSEGDPRELLFAFATLARSPNPQSLRDEAKRTIAQFPLSSMFGSSHHDNEGKVIYRSGGAGGLEKDDSAINRQIAQAEGIRRQIAVAGEIEVARSILSARIYLSEQTFLSLLQHSPFVPPNLVHTYAKGFARFFEGDFLSALCILTPMLENSLRHVLRLSGHDVTKFDDATQTQQDHTISVLFEQMRDQLDAVFGAAMTTDIEHVFLSRPGPCIRHMVAHGLISDGTPYDTDSLYACWLIYHLCCVPLIPHRSNIDFMV